MKIILQFLPAAFACGLVMGVTQSREFKRGLLRGLLSGALLAGGVMAAAVLVTLATDPSLLSSR